MPPRATCWPLRPHPPHRWMPAVRSRSGKLDSTPCTPRNSPTPTSDPCARHDHAASPRAREVPSRSALLIDIMGPTDHFRAVWLQPLAVVTQRSTVITVSDMTLRGVGPPGARGRGASHGSEAAHSGHVRGDHSRRGSCRAWALGGGCSPVGSTGGTGGDGSAWVCRRWGGRQRGHAGFACRARRRLGHLVGGR